MIISIYEDPNLFLLMINDKHQYSQQGSPDLGAAREVADYLGTRHHEFHFTVQVEISPVNGFVYSLLFLLQAGIIFIFHSFDFRKE